MNRRDTMTGDAIRLDTAERTTLASFDTYAEAQSLVDELADRRFPVQHLAILGEGLRMQEEITGRKGYGRAALDGAGAGAFTGAVIGFILGLFAIVEPLVSGIVLALVGLVIGAILGAIMGLLAHAALSGRRDFSSVSVLTAVRYDVVVDATMAGDAHRLLASTRR